MGGRPRLARLVAVAVACAAIAGGATACGGEEERLSVAEFSAELDRIDAELQGTYGAIVEPAKRLRNRPSAPVPAGIVEALPRLAADTRREADRLEELAVPAGAEAATRRLAEGMRRSAAFAESLAERPGLTVHELLIEEDPGSSIIEQARLELVTEGFFEPQR